MKKLLIVRLIIIVALGDVAKSGVYALIWKSSSVFPNGTVVKAYVGDNVTFPWEFVMNSTEEFVMNSTEEFVIEWTKTSENNPDQNKLALLAKNTFIGLSRERDVEFLPNAGIKLPNVTLADMGVYTVEIILFGQGKSYSQVAFLQVYERRPSSCVDVQKVDNVSGVHTIFVNGIKPVKVYCDQSTDNGGWTVIQRRQDGSVDFYRNWEQYENGFGDLNGEFWIGLANLHQLTTAKTVKLRVDLMDVYDDTGYSVYNTFNISGADDNYRLHVSGYSGTAGDSLAYHNEMQFSTFDRDHDSWEGNCANGRHGGWWYKICSTTNLNGLYKSDGSRGLDGVTWCYWKNDERSMKRVEMKIKESTLNWITHKFHINEITKK